jgi:hypothetical protein
VSLTIEWTADPSLPAARARRVLTDALSAYVASGDFKRAVAHATGSTIDARPVKASANRKRATKPKRTSRKRGGSSQQVNQLVRDQFRDLYRG